MVERHAGEFADLIRQEVDRAVEEKGRPVWTKVGMRTRHNEVQIQVITAKTKPGNWRAFATGFIEQDWVFHP